MPKQNVSGPEIYTIGHSTRSLEELVSMLKAAGVDLLLDVRTVPRSRHVPQFNKETLAKDLKKYDIEYRHVPELGGLRKTIGEESPNKGWRNASFRGFADYMQTDEFWTAIKDIAGLSHERKAALMCAEAVPWRCHRSLLADALTVLGVPVVHLMSEKSQHPHEMTEFAAVKRGRITYPKSD